MKLGLVLHCILFSFSYKKGSVPVRNIKIMATLLFATGVKLKQSL
jgi:hypothetical protein